MIFSTIDTILTTEPRGLYLKLSFPTDFQEETKVTKLIDSISLLLGKNYT